MKWKLVIVVDLKHKLE